jgi:spore germination cell wall hydrolase CwlJ-like protein
MNNKIIALIFVVFLSWFVVAIGISENNEIEDGIETTVCESEVIEESTDHNAVIPSATVPETTAQETTETETEPQETEEYNRGLTPEDQYLLAKIAMAEAEGESLHTKILVILTVLNRVETNGFPNTTKDVIFEQSNGVYQFSPIAPGCR